MQRNVISRWEEKLVASYPADGIVRAQKAGVVDRVLIEPGDRVQAEEVCVETHPADGTLSVKYSLSTENAQIYQSPDMVKVKVQTLVEDNETGCEILSTETLNASEAQCTYSEKTNQFEAVSTVSAPQGRPILGAGVEITLSAGFYEPHLNVVPAYCVRSDEGGEYVFILMQRDALFGVENYVLRMDVTVTARNGAYVDLLFSPGKQIVATSTQSLITGDVVVVQQP